MLLDVHLPDLSGLEVLGRLRSRRQAAGVVMVTAERDVEVVRAALHGGAMQTSSSRSHAELGRRLERVRQALGHLAAGEPTRRPSTRRSASAARAARRAPACPRD